MENMPTWIMEHMPTFMDDIEDAIQNKKLVCHDGQVGTISRLFSTQANPKNEVSFSYLDNNGDQRWRDVDCEEIYTASKKQKKKYKRHVVTAFECNYVCETLDLYVKLRRKQQKKARRLNT